METQLQGCYFSKKGPNLVTFFGYSTKSIPGLEINGIGKFGRGIKEKIIYITRCRNLPIPLKRFVLNVELSDDLGELEGASIKWLEFPLLLHYWYLAGLLPISKLDNCLAIGALQASGEIEESPFMSFHNICEENELHLISTQTKAPLGRGIIDANDLLKSIPDLKFKLKGFAQDPCIEKSCDLPS